MTQPLAPKPSRKPVPRLPVRALELASGFLYHRGAARPASTLAWAVAAGLASLPSEATDQPGIQRLTLNQDLWRDALFGDWHMESWDKREREAALSLIQLLVNHSQAILPALPAYPARPALTGTVLDKLWAHVDFAGWRLMRFLDDPELGPLVEAGEALLARLRKGVDLLEQFGLMMLKTYTDQGASAQDYTEELAQHLLGLHQILDTAARKAGRDPLGWAVPDYRRFAGTSLSLPPGPRGAVFPEPLATDFKKALASRECPRPLDSLGPLFGWYGALKEALECALPGRFRAGRGAGSPAGTRRHPCPQADSPPAGRLVGDPVPGVGRDVPLAHVHPRAARTTGRVAAAGPGRGVPGTPERDRPGGPGLPALRAQTAGIHASSGQAGHGPLRPRQEALNP